MTVAGDDSTLHKSSASFDKLTMDDMNQDHINAAHGVISLQGLSYTIQVPSSTSKSKIPFIKKKESRVLLNDITAAIRPGKLMALMGPSGAGKSTLLDVIAGRKRHGTIEGELLFDGKPRTATFRRLCGYVEQTDRLISELTPKEILYYTALMRLDRSMSNDDKKDRVNSIIIELGLESCCDTLIGEPGKRGISGGQAKRVNVGIELVTRPALLFLDEPTSGLDSATSLDVMKCIKDICDKGVSITCTIHQPGPEIFGLFENLLLLVRGEIVYLGPVRDAAAYFMNFGFKMPEDMNPADFIVSVTGDGKHALEQAGIEGPAQEFDKKQFAEAFRKSNMAKDRAKSAFAARIQITNDGDSIFDENSLYVNDIMVNMWILLRRIGTIRKRDRSFFMKRVGSILITAIVFLSVYVNSPLDEAGIRNRNSVILLSVAMLSISASSFVGPIMSERPFMYRERSAATYHPLSYYLANFIAEVPFTLMKAVLWCAILYFGVGFNSNFDRFGFHILVIIFVADIGIALANFFAFAFPSFELANGFMSTIPLIFMIFSGFFLPRDQIPWFWRATLYYISYIQYGFSALAVNEYAGPPRYCASDDKPCSIPITSSEIFESLGMAGYQTNKWISLCILVGIWLALRVAAYFSLSFFRHDGR